MTPAPCSCKAVTLGASTLMTTTMDGVSHQREKCASFAAMEERARIVALLMARSEAEADCLVAAEWARAAVLVESGA